ncbi:MAG TPA: hypothetical protein VL285_03655 [Bryobacteraceae bacterium]|nr:hypothetical protein [Bryobacteraceae bacterium]
MERAVEEFKIQTRALGPGAGSPQAGGASFRPQWHGRIFENFRNDALDAMPHEVRQRGSDKAILRRNQFGFNIAGPLWIPKLARARRSFVLLSYEGVRERISRTYLRTVPTLAERAGDYSAVVDQAGSLLPVFDPAGTRPNEAFDPARPVSVENLQYLRDPFPGNRIPNARLDEVSRKIVSYYPPPNAAAGPFFQNNYFVNSPETNTANGMIVKFDHSVKERSRISVQLSLSNGFLGAARWFPSAANPGASDRKYQTRSGSLQHVLTASSRTVNTLTFQAASNSSENGDATDSANYSAALSLRGIDGQSFPVMRFSPYLGMGHSYPISRNAQNHFVGTEALSTRRGRHGLRLVGQAVSYQVDTFWPQYPAGSFNFSSGLTSLPGIVNTGHAFASFLLGLADYAESSIVKEPSYFRRSQQLVALRDHYEAGKGLTISLGINLEHGTPRVEKYDRQSTVDLAAWNPVAGRKGALAAAGRAGYGRSFQPDRWWLEPSLSIAWNPPGDSRAVIRASFARSYSPIPLHTAQSGTQGFSGYPTYISQNVQLAPALVLAGGVPPSRPVPDLRPEAADNTVADLVDASGRLPTYQSVTLSVEREAPGSIAITAGVSHAGGKNLLVGNGAANPNALPLESLRFRDRLNDETFNRSLRAYPQYKGFDVYNAYSLGRYQRDSAFLRVERRASKGLSLVAYYEFSKQLDDYSGPYGKQDFFDRRNEWSLTPGSLPQRLEVSYVYELPFGPNKSFLNFGDWRRRLLDGWSISGTAALSSGNPIYLRPQFNNTGGVAQALHVNVAPGVNAHVRDPGPELWFNPAAFDQPPDFTIGDASRTHGSLRNPGNQNYDAALTKRFALSPDRTFEFSAQAFDFINHANWNDPDNVIGPAQAPNLNAGRIIGSAGGRVIQVGVRFSF